ncbi:hypothetical protein RvY_03923 [Ramazzottius varieornatus]|uniref:Methyltransferase type 11 domain-containing protein n=1 Tax=Ramazzottius varieornatus TaxID=947166 RepID=A0A1D1UZV6_RAMVA|nr:hypothetical protein RvY_03923 [Ramazzottius varieornatus]
MAGTMTATTVHAKPTFLLTNNKKGFMIQSIDEYVQSFFDYVKACPKAARVADFGVAYGYTSKELLKSGAQVIANDLSESQLHELWDTVSEEDRTHLELLPGNVLEIESIAENSLDGILACRWIHFLTGDELRTILGKFHKWLKPGGLLCVTAESVHLGSHKVLFDKYLERKGKNEEWPGFVKVKDLTTQRKQHMPESLMLYDTDVLGREVQKAGFAVEKIGYIDRPYYPEDLRNGGQEAIGALANKM